METEDSPTRVTRIVNGSGFPLQIAVENLVAQGAGRCRVLSSEHSWGNEQTGEAGFIDLILEHSEQNTVFVIECKRVLETMWAFLSPGPQSSSRRQAKVWETQYSRGKLAIFDWVDRAMDPSSPQSGYCTVDGQDAKSQPMLERVAGMLISATEAYAREEALHLESLGGPWSRLYTSVIVTTAKLVITAFSPEDISLTDGKVTKLTTREVPFVRFRKQLSLTRAKADQMAGADSRSIARAKERTVFVVQVGSLLKFLTEFSVDETRPPAI